MGEFETKVEVGSTYSLARFGLGRHQSLWMGLNTFTDELESRRKRRGRFNVGPVFLAFVAQGLVLLIAVFVVVIGPIFQSEPEFVAKKTIYLPQRELEHRMSVSEFQQAAQPPVMLNKLSSSSLLPNSVPPLPSMPQVDFKPVQMESPIANANALLGQSGLFGALSGVETEISTVSLFGLKTEATRIVICFDVSQSVKTKVERIGYTMEHVRDETRKVVEQLNANTLFGFIQFSRQYDIFRNYLVAATQANKQQAIDWLMSEFRTDGKSGSGWRRESPNGIQSVIKAAFSLDPQPDAVIVLSDGSFQRTPHEGGSEDVPWDEFANDLRRLQGGLPEPVKIHFIGFQMKSSDKSEMNKIVRLYRGKLREID